MTKLKMIFWKRISIVSAIKKAINFQICKTLLILNQLRVLASFKRELLLWCPKINKTKRQFLPKKERLNRQTSHSIIFINTLRRIKGIITKGMLAIVMALLAMLIAALNKTMKLILAFWRLLNQYFLNHAGPRISTLIQSDWIMPNKANKRVYLDITWCRMLRYLMLLKNILEKLNRVVLNLLLEDSFSWYNP